MPTQPTSSSIRLAGPIRVVAFAEAAHATRAVVIEFPSTQTHDPHPADVGVGKINVRHFGWITDDTMEPSASAELLAGEVAEWLEEIDSQFPA